MKNFSAFIWNTLVILPGIAAMILVFSLYRAIVVHEAAQKAAVDTYFAGYPAPESEIAVGNFYSCEAAIQESWPDKTNCFAVLQEMVPNGQYWKIIPGKKRLFQVKNPVGRSTLIYFAERTNGVISLKPIGTSFPSELQIERPDSSPRKASPKVRGPEA